MKNILFLLFLSLTACSGMQAMQEQNRLYYQALCKPSNAYEKGFNDGKAGADMSSSFAVNCDPNERQATIQSYQDGYKEANASKAVAQQLPVVINVGRDPWFNRKVQPKCSDYQKLEKSCMMSFEGKERELCQVCKENTSCFVGLKDKKSQGICQAYKEKSYSCFTALDGVDRSWCEHLKDNKSCESLFTGKLRQDCLVGKIPPEHYFWMN